METKEEFLEGNKLIAEFMGFDWQNETRSVFDTDSEFSTGWHDAPFEERDLEYHTSWDWLMPVVEKIESIGEEFGDTEAESNYHFFICKRYTRVRYNWNDYATGLRQESDLSTNGSPVSKDEFEKLRKSFKNYRHIIFEGDKLKSTWQAVVDFIEWHKSQTNSQETK